MAKFMKGKSGNPTGRPKKELTLSNLLQKELDKTVKGSDKTYMDMVINRLLGGVNRGERWAIEMIWDRIEGKPKQSVESSIEGDISINSNEAITNAQESIAELAVRLATSGQK